MKLRTDPPNPKEPINGILLLNKARGPSSNALLQRAKYLLGAKKAGHTGSLDPMATGMLPICFGESTKISQYLLEADKSYTATGLLGVKTNTADAMGEVVARVENFNVSEAHLRSVLDEFTGCIKQVPSMFSALKFQGTPLYEYARKGIDIERKARDITIYDLVLDHFDGSQFQITVRCSKGSYIRNLVEDIGDRLGVGAHVTQLHRLYTAGFDNDRMVTVDELAEMSLEKRRSLLLPMERAIAHMPRFSLTSVQSAQIRQGQIIVTDPSEYEAGIIRIYENDHVFLGLGEWISPTELKPKRLLATP
jgi:tRNA pseudouridine55 synthase